MNALDETPTQHDFRDQPTRAEHGCAPARYCAACDGSASFCRTCHGFSWTLTEHCVGRLLTPDELRAVNDSGWNFVLGRWRLPDPGAAAAATAAWWRAAIESPRDDPAAVGLSGVQKDIASLVLGKARRKVTPEAAAVFERALTKALVELLRWSRYVWLGVDYDPCKTLAAACDAAGLSRMCLPYKTKTHCRPTYVVLSRDHTETTVYLGAAT